MSVKGTKMINQALITKRKYNFLIYLILITTLCFVWPSATLASIDEDAMEQVWKTSKAFIGISKKAIPTVVFIEMEKSVDTGQTLSPFEFNNPFDLFNDDFFNRFLGHRYPHQQRPREYKQKGWSSGFIFSAEAMF